MNVRATARLPAAVGLTAIGLLAAVLFGAAQAAIFATPWVVLLVLGLSRPGPALPTITSHVSDERVMVGDSVRSEAELDSENGALVSLVPTWQRPSRAEDGRRALASGAMVHGVRPGERSAVAIDVPFAEWGAWQLSSYAVRVVNPYGLVVGSARVNERLTVRVHPRTVDLRRLIAPMFLRRSTGRHTSRTSGRGIEYADIRSFAPGDQVRDINWLASARRGDLQVSDRHPERATDVILLIDTLVESGHDIERVLSLTANAALAAGAGHLGATDRVGLVEFGGVINWLAPATGTRHLHRLTDALLSSVTFANSSDKALPLLAPSVWPPRSFVIAVSPLLDERFVDALYEARRRGHDVAVIHIDALDDLDVGPESELEALSRRLVRVEQAALRNELAAHGITVAVWTRNEPVEQPLLDLGRARQRSRNRR